MAIKRHQVARRPRARSNRRVAAGPVLPGSRRARALPPRRQPGGSPGPRFHRCRACKGSASSRNGAHARPGEREQHARRPVPAHDGRQVLRQPGAAAFRSPAPAGRPRQVCRRRQHGMQPRRMAAGDRAFKAGALVCQVGLRGQLHLALLGMRASTPVPTSRTWSCARPLSFRGSSGTEAQGCRPPAAQRQRDQQSVRQGLRASGPNASPGHAMASCRRARCRRTNMLSAVMPNRSHRLGAFVLQHTPMHRRAASRAAVRCVPAPRQPLALFGVLLRTRGFTQPRRWMARRRPRRTGCPACSSACPGAAGRSHCATSTP